MDKKLVQERLRGWVEFNGWLEQFAQALERPEIVTRYESLRAQVER